MKLLANSSYGYQIKNWSQQFLKKYLNDEKTHATINSKLFRKLDQMNFALYEVELSNARIEHKQPSLVGFFFLQYAKLQILGLYCSFSKPNFVT